MVINRKLLLREKSQLLLKRHDPVAFATEFPILATDSTSGRELYEQVWMRVRSMLQLSVHDRSLLWWTKCDHSKTKAENAKKTLAPFVLKHVAQVKKFDVLMMMLTPANITCVTPEILLKSH